MGDGDKADRADEADDDEDDDDDDRDIAGRGTGGIYKHACSFVPFEIMPSSSYKHTSWLVPTPHNLPWNKKLYFAPHDMPHRNYVQ